MREMGAIRLLQELVRIPSVNPALPGGTGEAEMGQYVAAFWARLGLPYAVHPVAAGRDNVIGMLRQDDRLPTLLLEAHMDTVQTEGMTIAPYGAECREGRLYGRGACDTKASLAAMLGAVERLRLSGEHLPVNVHVAAVVDEEVHYRGVLDLARRIREGELAYTAAIVGEPTGLDIVAAHKGVIRFYIEAGGIAGHSSEPEKASNAIEQMTSVIRHMSEEAVRLRQRDRHPLVGLPTCCITEIHGGRAPNVIPDNCRITIDRRTVPGEEPMEVWTEIREQLLALAERTPGLQLSVSEPFILDYAMETAADHPLARQLAQAAWRGAERGRVIGAPYCSDASKLTRVGVPTVVFGPGSIAQAHTADEWVDLEQVAQAEAILMDVIRNWQA
ncbi:M20 family metallopeptidase [Paenibacillus sp. 1P07SE]|uniref:M20 family metallopeptidase n=1 Tax=Paenibacillus sp. 1P07SE TaxID=3132209 RepID=UPI0039A6EC95